MVLKKNLKIKDLTHKIDSKASWKFV